LTGDNKNKTGRDIIGWSRDITNLTGDGEDNYWETKLMINHWKGAISLTISIQDYRRHGYKLKIDNCEYGIKESKLVRKFEDRSPQSYAVLIKKQLVKRKFPGTIVQIYYIQL